MKKYISDILHDADEKAIDIIADNHMAADNSTKERIYRKSLRKIGFDYETNELFTAETVKRSTLMEPAIIAAACLLVLAGAVFGLLKMNAAPPSPVDDTPVIVATATTVSKTTDTVGTTAETRLTASVTTPKSVETARTETETAAKTEAVKTDITETMPDTAAALNTTNIKSTTTNVKSTTTNVQITTADATTTVTAPTVPGQHMTMEEIEKWEKSHWATIMTRERAIYNGKIDADSPRITLEQVKQFIAESSDFDEIFAKIQSVQQYQDIDGGSGVWLIEYWVGGNRNDIVMVDYFGKNISHITSPDGELYGSGIEVENLFGEQ